MLVLCGKTHGSARNLSILRLTHPSLPSHQSGCILSLTTSRTPNLGSLATLLRTSRFVPPDASHLGPRSSQSFISHRHSRIKEILTRHKPMVAEYLEKNYDKVIIHSDSQSGTGILTAFRTYFIVLCHVFDISELVQLCHQAPIPQTPWRDTA